MNRDQELYLIKNIAELLNKETDLTSMLQQVLDKLLHLTGLQTGWIFLLDEKQHYTLAASSRLPEALAYENKRYLCEGRCYCINQYIDGRLKEAANIIECKRIEDAIRSDRGKIDDITHHASVPLKSGEELFGILNVAAPVKNSFTQDELHILESIAYQIGSAYERIRLSEKEKTMKVFEERNRLARDLHDSVNQQLFSIMYTATGVKRQTKDPLVNAALKDIHSMSKDALAQMKALIWQLRSDRVEEGLANRLGTYSKKLGLTLITTGQFTSIPSQIEVGLWKIGQEALNNISKHSGSNTCTISLKEDSLYYEMKVSDSGKGFKPDTLTSDGMGLISMKERASLLGGSFCIESEAEQGTTITITVLKRGEPGD
ncbi:GAF domain-containing sensor histidine kinase [Bacillus sp. H-16]|uniref:GAF domain-containing sensor histidine kinase n=1 Tax=Alteribacter salitolerans TaxID=2912333 RepID=UPI00196623C4|nr:GAF domain-containing sensor histidine kinase [Alteribacter salitolerans]MBM7097436.1 GAF domain-containing sensor histidine kinase [Alteribacter salitolerans]